MNRIKYEHMMIIRIRMGGEASGGGGWKDDGGWR
jgi:hypothetical protein